VLFAWSGQIHGMTSKVGDAVVIPEGFTRLDRAWVIDLEGSVAVRTGAALARLGVQPIPLFNGVPDFLNPAIEVSPILMAFELETVGLASVPADAPPAFLLDHRRMEPQHVIVSGVFDNRRQVAPQDFPSARRLQGTGITRVVVLIDRVCGDLAHVLRRWQEAGIALSHMSPEGSECLPFVVPAPRWYRSIWWRVLVLSGMRPNGAGGFGSRVPLPSEGGGYG
jgi:hypothetical protein